MQPQVWRRVWRRARSFEWRKRCARAPRLIFCSAYACSLACWEPEQCCSSASPAISGSNRKLLPSASDGLASRLRSWEQQAGLAPSRESGAPSPLSVRFRRAWQDAGSAILLEESSTAVIVNKDAPLLALVGLFRPRLIISDALLRSLSLEELQVALLHENAHRDSRDNLKRLVLLLAPAPIPFFRVFSALEQSWAKLSEWAADDEAVRGDSQRALSLATALLRVARMMGAAPCLSFLHTSLCAGDHDLSARVDRLLALQSPLQKRSHGRAPSPSARPSGPLLASSSS